MTVRVFAALIVFSIVSGCQQVATSNLTAIPDFVRDAVREGGGGTRAASGKFEDGYQALRAAAGKSATRAAPASDSPAVLAILRTDVVQGVVDEVYQARTGGAPSATSVRLPEGKFREFRDLLSDTRATLMDDVARGKAGEKKLDRILIAYLREYAAGEFVDRNGTEIAKPSLNGGINNEAITGLATVFWEALFDFWTDVPVFVEREQEEEFKASYRAPKANEVRPVFTRVVEAGKEDKIVTEYQEVKPDERTVFYTRSVHDVYVTDDGRVPTAVKLKVAGTERLVDAGQTGITAGEAKFIKSASNLAGKQANSLAAGIFGFLGKINVGFVLVGGFSVGDDKTLLEIVKVSAEVATRRGTQAAIYAVLKEGVTRSPEFDRLVTFAGTQP